MKRTLLGMLGGAAPPLLDPGQWAMLDAMASQHRLRPLLAWHMNGADAPWPVPAPLAEQWNEARHTTRLVNLALFAGLQVCRDTLQRAAIGFAALKGPRLAWRCYPESALRPMRDLDLLLAEDDVLRAARVLREAGFAMPANDAVAANALKVDKALPDMHHSGLGVILELHHRLTVPPAGQGYAIPQLDAAGVLRRREDIDLAGLGVPCPTSTDLLAHLMVHALYGHRLDCGPLVLADIHFLLRSEAVEAVMLERMAEEGGWLRGAALLLALTERYFGPQPLTLGETPPEAVLSAAEEMLLQDLDKRDHTTALADLFAARSPAAMAASLKRRLLPDAHVLQEEGQGQPLWRFWPGWAARRGVRLARRLLDRRAGREAGHTVALLRWLQQG